MLTREQVLSGEYDAFFHGQRMMLPENLGPDVLDHDIDDSAGIVYYANGTRTCWHFTPYRMSTPDWQPFRIPQEPI